MASAVRKEVDQCKTDALKTIKMVRQEHDCFASSGCRMAYEKAVKKTSGTEWPIKPSELIGFVASDHFAVYINGRDMPDFDHSRWVQGK